MYNRIQLFSMLALSISSHKHTAATDALGVDMENIVVFYHYLKFDFTMTDDELDLFKQFFLNM